jgi:hypothetical protein
MDFVLQVAVATKAGKKAIISLDGDKGKMQRQLEDKLDVEDTTKSIAHIEVNPNSLLGKAIEDSYYYDEEDGLLDLNSIVEKLNGFDSWQEIYEDIVNDTSEIDEEFSNKTFFDFDDDGMDQIFSILNRDPMYLAKAIHKSPNFNWTDPYLWIDDNLIVGTSTDNTDLDFSDKGLQKAVLEKWLSEA